MTTSVSDSRVRPLRRDAARNRQLLLDAGREVFAVRGLEATLDEIAHHAGVGVGTAYRHFVNKQQLAAAIFSDDFAQAVAAARAALDIDDPWDALVSFVVAMATKHAKDRGLYEAFVGQSSLEPPVVEIGDEVTTMREALTEPVTALVDRARSAGCIRAECSPTDVAAIFIMMGAPYTVSDAVGRPAWQRYLWLLLDGLRATDRPPLPDSPLSFAELDAAIAAIKRH